MRRINPIIWDGLGMGLSVACMVHCLALPLVSVWFLAAWSDNEWVHWGVLTLALPLAIFALGRGFYRHRRMLTLILGGCGLCMLVGGVLVAPQFGETFEKTLTVLGGTCLAMAHFTNARLVRQCPHCHSE